MVDVLSPEQRHKCMSRIRSTDTKPEILVRKLVHRLGYRFRLHCGDLPGKPDLVLRRHKKVIFVHGCFWHMHDDSDCKLSRLPKSRLNYWKPKLIYNKNRDKRNIETLKKEGWSVLTVWECQLKDIDVLKRKLTEFLS